MIRLIVLFLLAFKVDSYIPSLLTKKNVRKFENLNEITVFEPIKSDRKESSCVIFFTGGNSIMPPDIYSDFLEKLASKNLAVYVPNLGYNKFEKFAGG